jgi:hypothetical protein
MLIAGENIRNLLKTTFDPTVHICINERENDITIYCVDGEIPASFSLSDLLTDLCGTDYSCRID